MPHPLVQPLGKMDVLVFIPAILAVMVAPVVGIDPMTPGFIATLLLVITFSSFGVAGVGGWCDICRINGAFSHEPASGAGWFAGRC